MSLALVVLNSPVDPVVIINNTIASVTQAYLTICCNCKGDNSLDHYNCKRHNLLCTAIARVIIDFTLDLARSHYSSGPGWKYDQGS
jgi:hypothetical protein